MSKANPFILGKDCYEVFTPKHSVIVYAETLLRAVINFQNVYPEDKIIAIEDIKYREATNILTAYHEH